MWNFKKLLDFSDKTVIITGGAGLLGRVYAVALLQTGAKVILFDKKIDKITFRHESGIDISYSKSPNLQPIYETLKNFKWKSNRTSR